MRVCNFQSFVERYDKDLSVHVHKVSRIFFDEFVKNHPLYSYKQTKCEACKQTVALFSINCSDMMTFVAVKQIFVVHQFSSHIHYNLLT